LGHKIYPTHSIDSHYVVNQFSFITHSIDICFLHHKIQCLKVYKWMLFGMFTEHCNHHNALMLEGFHYSKKSLMSNSIHSPCAGQLSFYKIIKSTQWKKSSLSNKKWNLT
jgi:hypothetical protein